MSARTVGLVAGRGRLPEQIIHLCNAQNRPLVILAIEGQTPEALVSKVPHRWVKFGEIEKALSFLKEHHVQDLVFVGGLTRPSLKSLSLDKTAAKWLAKIGLKAFGDDGLLSGVLDLFKKEGFSVVGCHELLKDLHVVEGILGCHEPTSQDREDITRGQKVLKKMGSLDIGQGVIIEHGVVLAVEAAEGTDAMILRVKDLKKNPKGGVLVKLPKSDQSRSVDLPTIGPQTIKNAQAAGLSGIAIEAQGTLVVEREQVIALADKAGIFLRALPHDP